MTNWRNNGGLYVGCRVANLSPDPPPPSEAPVNLLGGQWETQGNVLGYSEERHIILFGPNGSGKSRRVLLANLCRLTDWSTVVIDTKGELCAHTAAHRAKSGSVIVVDPFGVMAKNYPHVVAAHPWLAQSHGLNPMSFLAPETPRFVDNCKLLAEALIKVDEKDKYWGQAGQALVAGLLMALKLDAGQDAALPHLRQLVGQPAKVLGEVNKDFVARFGAQKPALAAALNRFTEFDPANRELSAILGTVLTQTGWLDSDPIRADLSKGTYDFGRLKTGAEHRTGERRPVTVYLILPPDYLESHATWLRVVLASILMPLLRDVEQHGEDFPVLFALDEYAALGHMELFERNMAMMRGYGVKLLLVLQDLAQLKDVHADRWESFIANAGLRLLFAPQDYTTQEYFSKLSGQTVWTYTTRSTNASASRSLPSLSVRNIPAMFTTSETSGENTGESKSLVPRYAPEHLGTMQKGQAVLFVAEGRSGDANLRIPTILPDPQSAEAAVLIPEIYAVMTEARRVIDGGG